MGKLGDIIGPAIGGAASMFPAIGTAVGGGWLIKATRHLDPEHKGKKRKKRKRY